MVTVVDVILFHFLFHSTKRTYDQCRGASTQTNTYTRHTHTHTHTGSDLVFTVTQTNQLLETHQLLVKYQAGSLIHLNQLVNENKGFWSLN